MKILKKLTYFIALCALLFSGCKKETISGVKIAVPVGSSPDELVASPYGPLLKSHVFLIESGYHVQIVNNHVLKVETKTGKLIKDFGAIHESITTAANTVKNPVNVRLRQANFAVENTGSSPNWQTYAQWQNTTGSPITSFKTTWVVPSNPTDATSTNRIFIYCGLQDTNSGDDIVQPILQWGLTAAGGGYKWEVASWYLWVKGDTTYAAISNPTPVSQGTTVTGVITSSGSTDFTGSYSYGVSFSGFPSSLLTVSNGGVFPSTNGAIFPKNYKKGLDSAGIVVIQPVPQQLWAFETIESQNSVLTNGVITNYGYDVASSAGYPADLDVAMKNISLTTLSNSPTTLNWTPVTTTIAFWGEHTNVIDTSAAKGEVDLYFHSQIHSPVTAPIISYVTPNVFEESVAIGPLVPNNSGGQVASYSITPTLPAGLIFNPSSGEISGTATVSSPATNYLVTAGNVAGSSRFTLNISVLAGATVTYASYALGAGISNIAFTGGPLNTTYNFTTTTMPGNLLPGTYKVVITPVGQKYGMYDNGKGYTNVVFADGANGYCFGYTGGNFTFNWTVVAGHTLNFSVYNNWTCPFN